MTVRAHGVHWSGHYYYYYAMLALQLKHLLWLVIALIWSNDKALCSNSVWKCIFDFYSHSVHTESTIRCLFIWMRNTNLVLPIKSSKADREVGGGWGMG